MDDGDILNNIPRAQVVPEEAELHVISSPGDPNLALNQSCAGCIDFSHLRSLPESDKRRFCVWRRAEFPLRVARDLLRSSFDNVGEDVVVALSAMAKSFVVKTIERVRAGRETSNPITVSELRDLSSSGVVVELGAI